MTARQRAEPSGWKHDARIVSRGPGRTIVLRLLAQLGADSSTDTARERHATVSCSDFDPEMVGPSYTAGSLHAEVEASLRRIFPDCVVSISNVKLIKPTGGFSWSIKVTLAFASVEKAS